MKNYCEETNFALFKDGDFEVKRSECPGLIVETKSGKTSLYGILFNYCKRRFAG